MKTVILAGGLGTRLAEETEVRPKPMIEVGNKPIIWHIMKIYAHHGITDFVVALGYKGEHIKRYFLEYPTLTKSFKIVTSSGQVQPIDGVVEDWTVELIDTGHETQTGGRVKKLVSVLNNQTFMLTYGDGVGDIDISALLAFHRSHGKLATVTAVRPPSRFGGLVFKGDEVCEFSEKPQIGEGWINGGFFVMEPEVIEYIESDDVILEKEPLENLAADGQLMAYKHDSFWQPMDTLREVHMLRTMWERGDPLWKIWNE